MQSCSPHDKPKRRSLKFTPRLENAHTTQQERIRLVFVHKLGAASDLRTSAVCLSRRGPSPSTIALKPENKWLKPPRDLRQGRAYSVALVIPVRVSAAASSDGMPTSGRLALTPLKVWRALLWRPSPTSSQAKANSRVILIVAYPALVRERTQPGCAYSYVTAHKVRAQLRFCAPREASALLTRPPTITTSTTNTPLSHPSTMHHRPQKERE